MPQPTNHETLTVGEVFQNALYNYETVIDKYESLLVKIIEHNTTMVSQINRLPDETKVEKILNNFVTVANDKILQEHNKLDIKENANSHNQQQLVTDLTKIVSKLTNKIYLLIAVLVVCSGFGFAALTYVKHTLNVIEKHQHQQQQMTSAVDSRGPFNKKGVKTFWIDENGTKRYIQIEEPVERSQ